MKTTCVRAVIILLAVRCQAWALAPCSEWQQVCPWPAGGGFVGVAYGDGRFVAVGGLASSEDGVVWTPGHVDDYLGLSDVTWAGDRFVAVGSYGMFHFVEPRVAVSVDGSTWAVSAPDDSGSEGSLGGVTCAGPACVAVGAAYLGGPSSLLYFSPDGEQWARVASPGTYELRTAAWGNGAWVAAGDGILRSTDGAVWGLVSSDWWVHDLTWDGSRFLALTSDGVIASQDGVSWTRLGAFPADLAAGFIASNGRQLVAGGRTTIDQAVLATSVDGVVWFESVGIPNVVWDAAWAEGQWVAVGGPGLVGTSPDGLTWRWHVQGSNHRLADVAWSGDELMAAGGSSSSRSDILVSADGVSWRDDSRPGQALTDLHWSGERWVAVGEHGTVVASRDGREWLSLAPDPDPEVTWGAGASSPTRLVVAGCRAYSDGVLAVMDEGGGWHFPAVSGAGALEDVLWIGSLFVVVGDGATGWGGPGLVGWSEDGLAWTFTATDGVLVKLAVDDHRVVAVGAAGAALWSDDGRSWALAQTGTAAHFTDLVWAGERFVAATSDRELFESPDGETWAPTDPIPLSDLEGLAWTGRELVAVTGGGTISRRRCGEEYLLPESASRVVVPVAAHRPGAAGTFWRSDLQVVSPSDYWSEVWLGLVPSGAESPTWQRFLLPPGGQLDRDDLVARTFGVEGAAGPLLVASEQPLAVVSRSFSLRTRPGRTARCSLGWPRLTPWSRVPPSCCRCSRRTRPSAPTSG